MPLWGPLFCTKGRPMPRTTQGASGFLRTQWIAARRTSCRELGRRETTAVRALVWGIRDVNAGRDPGRGGRHKRIMSRNGRCCAALGCPQLSKLGEPFGERGLRERFFRRFVGFKDGIACSCLLHLNRITRVALWCSSHASGEADGGTICHHPER